VSSELRSNGLSTTNYSGVPRFESCLLDVDSSSKSVTSDGNLVRPITDDDVDPAAFPVDLRHTGSEQSQNPDGSRAHIGVVGGPYAW